MGGLGHGPAASGELDTAATSQRNARWGLWLFALYLFFYAGFMVISTFLPDVLDQRPVAGINLAILYGLGLILAALLLSLLYGWVCRNPVTADASGTAGERQP